MEVAPEFGAEVAEVFSLAMKTGKSGKPTVLLTSQNWFTGNPYGSLRGEDYGFL